MEINWLSYIIVIVITTFIVAIISENVVIDRLQMSEGVQIVAGRCRLRQGYGKLGLGYNNNNLGYNNSTNNFDNNKQIIQEQQEFIEFLQKENSLLKKQLNY